MATNCALSPSTGDYIIENGRPVEDGSLNVPSYIRLKVKRTQWLYAPDTNYGSDFYLFSQRHLQQSDIAMVSVGQNALQPLIDDGRASSVQVSILASSGNAYEQQAIVTQANGEESTLTFNPIGN